MDANVREALPGLCGEIPLHWKRDHAEAVEEEEPTRHATKRRRQSVRRGVGRSVLAQGRERYAFPVDGQFLSWPTCSAMSAAPIPCHATLRRFLCLTLRRLRFVARLVGFPPLAAAAAKRWKPERRGAGPRPASRAAPPEPTRSASGSPLPCFAEKLRRARGPAPRRISHTRASSRIATTQKARKISQVVPTSLYAHPWRFGSFVRAA